MIEMFGWISGTTTRFVQRITLGILFLINAFIRLILPPRGNHHADRGRWRLWRNAKGLATKVHGSMADRLVQHWHGPHDRGDWISASVSAPAADPTSPSFSLARLHLYVTKAAVATSLGCFVILRDIDSIVIENRTVNWIWIHEISKVWTRRQIELDRTISNFNAKLPRNCDW